MDGKINSKWLDKKAMIETLGEFYNIQCFCGHLCSGSADIYATGEIFFRGGKD